MGNVLNLTGVRFGKLVSIERDKNIVYENGEIVSCWKCKCDCGNFVTVRTCLLRKGSAKSCGCAPKTKKHNEYKVVGSEIFVKANKTLEFVVDAENLDLIKDYHWNINANGYVIGWINKTPVILHRIIAKASDGEMVDHINGNKLDNRASNLRIVTNQENCMNRKLVQNNTSGVTGVYWNKTMNKWQAQIMYKGKYRYLGCFSDINDAIAVRKEAEKQYFGEFAYKGEKNG